MDQLILAPAARREAILDVMRSARNSLVMSLFRCDDFGILDEVAAAVKRHVVVRVLITRRARGWKQRLRELRTLLRSMGADVRPYRGPVIKYHAKYLVADGRLALVSSLNLTRKCFEDTCDFVVVTDAPDVISGLQALFENDYASPHKPVPDVSPRLIIGPEYARERFTQMIAEAQTRIRIMDHRVTDARILDQLRAKQNHGVSIEILGAGIMGGLTPHGRMILIDDELAAIGSIRLSPPSLDSRREVAIIVQEPGVIAPLSNFFESLAADPTNVIRSWETPPDGVPDDDDDEDDENDVFSAEV